MSDHETRPIEPEGPPPSPQAGLGGTGAIPDAPAPEAAALGPSYPRPQWQGQAQGQPAYAMPLPAGYPAYGAPQQQRPRFADQVIGMRAVIVVALVCLLVGGLAGAVLGRATGNNDRFGGPGGGFFQRGGFPGGPPNQGLGQGGR